MKKMENRKIIHIDMDAFYASVEQRDHPEYRGKPLAVGRPEERGVVAAASYEARKFGIRSAMSSMQALKLCPDLIFVRGRMEDYKAVSEEIHRIFHEYTDLIEPLALDEAFLDVTENKKNIPLAVDIARAIKKEIREKLGLVASAGVSYNKFLAKIASDYRKPDGLFVIHPRKAAAFIARLPIEVFWGIGKVTAHKMHALGIHNGAQLRNCSLEFLNRNFGKTRSISVGHELYTMKEILPLAKQLLAGLQLTHYRIRLMGLTVSNPVSSPDDPEQGIPTQLEINF